MGKTLVGYRIKIITTGLYYLSVGDGVTDKVEDAYVYSQVGILDLIERGLYEKGGTQRLIPVYR